MSLLRGLVTGLFALGLFFLASGVAAEELLVTRYFTGLWDQVDQESQGITLQVIEQSDDSRVALAYWFTYGSDRKSAWYLGIGTLIEDRMEFNLFDSTDVGFLEDAKPGDESVAAIGTMTITFDSCDSGNVTFETDHPEVGSGSFRIQRLTDIMNTHCSGGISDDMGTYGMFGEQQIQLDPARSGITGSGHARYGDAPGHMEFEIEVTGLADGTYHLFVGGVDHGEFMINSGFGEFEFSSPLETGKHLMTFDPRGMTIEIHDASGAVLSSFGNMFDFEDHDEMGHDEDHDYGCADETGGGPGHGTGHGGGHGMYDCVEEGVVLQIHADLLNSGLVPAASGEAEWEMTSQRVEFSVEIEDVPDGNYPLMVGGTEVGTIAASDMHGKVVGIIRFRDPEVFGKEHLDFDPRGQTIQVLSNGDSILEVDFPLE